MAQFRHADAPQIPAASTTFDRIGHPDDRAVSTDDLLDLAPSVGQRASEIRFDVLDISLTVIGEIAVNADQPPTVNHDANRSINRTLDSIGLSASVQEDLDPFGHRLRPVWVLENGEEFNLGVFILGSIDRMREEYGLDAQVAAVDQTVIVDDPIPTTVALSTGANIRDAIIAQFGAALVPSYEVDPAITTVTGAPIAWPAGTSRLKVINELAAMAGAYSTFFDNDGVGRIQRIPDLASVTPDLVYVAGGRIMAGSMVESDDLLDSPNRYLVIDSSNPDTPVVGSYDVPDEAPHSIANRGFAVTHVISEQGLATVSDANARAYAAYIGDRGGFEWVQFSSPPDPRHDTHEPVEYLGAVYREQGWRLPLREGAEHTHDLRRVYAA